MKSAVTSITVREGGEFVLIASNGDRFRPRREDGSEPLPPTDADLVNQFLDETAGSWSDLDTDRFITERYETRVERSRTSHRPE